MNKPICKNFICSEYCSQEENRCTVYSKLKDCPDHDHDSISTLKKDIDIIYNKNIDEGMNGISLKDCYEYGYMQALKDTTENKLTVRRYCDSIRKLKDIY